MNFISKAALAIVFAVGLTSCVNLDPMPDPTRYFLLSAPSNGQPPEVVEDGLRIGIREVQMPDYLEPSRIALRKGQHEIVYSDYRRWGENMTTSAGRVLGNVLQRQLNSRYVSLFPWPSNLSHDYILRVTFTSFEGATDGTVYVGGRWSLSAPDEPGILASRAFQLRSKWDGDDVGSLAEALSGALGQLGNDISAVIADVNAGKPGPKE